jgi:hypothetical protein
MSQYCTWITQWRLLDLWAITLNKTVCYARFGLAVWVSRFNYLGK